MRWFLWFGLCQTDAYWRNKPCMRIFLEFDLITVETYSSTKSLKEQCFEYLQIISNFDQNRPKVLHGLHRKLHGARLHQLYWALAMEKIDSIKLFLSIHLALISREMTNDLLVNIMKTFRKTQKPTAFIGNNFSASTFPATATTCNER